MMSLGQAKKAVDALGAGPERRDLLTEWLETLAITDIDLLVEYCNPAASVKVVWKHDPNEAAHLARLAELNRQFNDYCGLDENWRPVTVEWE